MWLAVCGMIGVAAADTWGPISFGFVSPEREDAPTDGQIVYGSNYVPEAMVTAGPGAPFPLDARLLTGVGGQPRSLILPPDRGWEPGATYTITVDTYGYKTKGDPADTFTFSVGHAAATTPGELEVSRLEVGPWTEDRTEYPWGCCARTRGATLVATLPDDADPWARVEVLADYALVRPGQIGTEPIHERLDVGVGPGEHETTFVQWFEDLRPQPPCVDVVALSASGEAGPTERRCAGGPPPCGCQHPGPAPLGGLAGLGLLMGLRRRRQASNSGGACSHSGRHRLACDG